jgi:hypothetical protein
LAENGNGNGGESVEEVAEELAEEVAEEVADELSETPDVNVTVIEAPEPEEPEAKFASVDVGDLHISGPAEMVESITEKYLKDHIDHNPHGFGEGMTTSDGPEGAAERIGDAITPDVVEEQIQESAAGEIVDNPPEPEDWLFRRRGGS